MERNQKHLPDVIRLSYKLLVMDEFRDFKNDRITLEQLEDKVVDLVDELEYNFKDYPELKEEGKV